MEITEGSFRADLHAVLADDEHAVALVVIAASRSGFTIAPGTRSFITNYCPMSVRRK